MLIDATTFRDDLEILLFHGTTTDHENSFREQVRIFEPKRRTVRDFGTGFYTTTFYWQAVRYAESMARLATLSPMVVCCSTTLGELRRFRNSKVIDDYDLGWMETIKQGRWGETPLDYDWIYGRCGDGPTAKIQREFKSGAANDVLLTYAVPRSDTPYYYYDQLWFGTEDAVRVLTLRSIIKPRWEENQRATVSVS